MTRQFISLVQANSDLALDIAMLLIICAVVALGVAAWKTHKRAKKAQNAFNERFEATQRRIDEARESMDRRVKW